MTNRQLRARRALLQFKDVPLRARRALLQFKDVPLRTRRALYAVKAQTSLAPLSRFCGSRVTTAHAHQCCIFQSYAKTVPSRMKLTMKLTMRKPTFMGSMTTDT